MATNLTVNSGKRVYLCRTHYKEWKKATKEDRETEKVSLGLASQYSFQLFRLHNLYLKSNIRL